MPFSSIALNVFTFSKEYYINNWIYWLYRLLTIAFIDFIDSSSSIDSIDSIDSIGSIGSINSNFVFFYDIMNVYYTPSKCTAC